MKKLISLALACSFMMAAAVMPMTGAAAEMQVIDFSAAEGASYGGTFLKSICIRPDRRFKRPSVLCMT